MNSVLRNTESVLSQHSRKTKLAYEICYDKTYFSRNAQRNQICKECYIFFFPGISSHVIKILALLTIHVKLN